MTALRPIETFSEQLAHTEADIAINADAVCERIGRIALDRFVG